MKSAVAVSVAAAGLPRERGRIARLRPFASGRILGEGAGREVIRHYTHLSERIDGLARAAGCPTESLMALHVTSPRPSGAGPLLAPGAGAVLAAGLEGVDGPCLARGLPGVLGGDPGWLVRRSRPEVGFRSIEVTLPWLVSALAGVNESGLLVAYVAECERATAAVGGGADSILPPALLLVQECLQRFEGLEAAVDWCLNRPAGGWAKLLLADASGAMAVVDFEGATRRVSRALASPYCVAAGDAVVAGGRIAPEQLLVEAGDGAKEGAGWLRLDAARRLLEVRGLGGSPTVVALQA